MVGEFSTWGGRLEQCVPSSKTLFCPESCCKDHEHGCPSKDAGSREMRGEWRIAEIHGGSFESHQR